MGLFRPRKPSKAGARMSVWEMLFNGKFPFGNDSNGKWSVKSGTYFYTPNFPASSAGGSNVSGMIFRGEYDTAATYAAKDMVVIRAGANAGTFVCILANSAKAPQLPDTGNLYWISISNSPVMGAWM